MGVCDGTDGEQCYCNEAILEFNPELYTRAVRTSIVAEASERITEDKQDSHYKERPSSFRE